MAKRYRVTGFVQKHPGDRERANWLSDFWSDDYEDFEEASRAAQTLVNLDKDVVEAHISDLEHGNRVLAKATKDVSVKKSTRRKLRH